MTTIFRHAGQDFPAIYAVRALGGAQHDRACTAQCGAACPACAVQRNVPPGRQAAVRLQPPAAQHMHAQAQ